MAKLSKKLHFKKFQVYTNSLDLFRSKILVEILFVILLTNDFIFLTITLHISPKLQNLTLQPTGGLLF